MWQLIAKGILGGVGGGMKAASEQPTISTNQTSTADNSTNEKEQQTGSAAGSLLTKILKRGTKKDEEKDGQ